MFKKIRKYLIVLMAVLMVASFAVIPTAALTGGKTNDMYLSWGQWHRQIDVWAEDTYNAFHTDAIVYDPAGGGTAYDDDPRYWPIGSRVGYSNAYGPSTENYALAVSYDGDGSWWLA